MIVERKGIFLNAMKKNFFVLERLCADKENENEKDKVFKDEKGLGQKIRIGKFTSLS